MPASMTETAAVGWVPIARVAEELGSTPLNVLMYIKRGLLVGEEIDGQWQVETRSLSELLRRRLAGNAPAVCRSACARHAGGCGSCA